MRSTIIFIVIILNPIYLLAQDEKKLSKKEANEEVKRLTILIENLESEKEELNNKLMIEYEKLLAEMDQNSDLRNVNGELRSEIRSMQQQVLEFQKSFSEKKTEIENLNNKISNYKSKLLNDSISIEKLNLLTQKQIIQLEKDSIEIIYLKDSFKSSNNYILSLEKINDSLKYEHNYLYNQFENIGKKIEEGNLIEIELADPNNKNNALIYYIHFTEDKQAILAFILLKINYTKCIENNDVFECVDVLISQCFMNDNGPTKKPGPGDEFLWENRCADYYLLNYVMDNYLDF